MKKPGVFHVCGKMTVTRDKNVDWNVESKRRRDERPKKS
jgi:hypothetical protein